MNKSTFFFDESKGSAHWLCGNIPICIDNIGQACVDAARNFIAVLPRKGSGSLVNLYAPPGDLMFSIVPPDGYVIEYLLSDDSHGVRVVCSNKSASGDVLDWYFKIDLSKKLLVKQGRAY